MSTVGDYFDKALIRGIDEGIGAGDIAQSMQATPADGALEMPVGSQGDTGITGPDAYPWRYEGDIADQAALQALAPKLGAAQAGKAWRVLSTNTIAYWNGSSWDNFTEAIGGRGPDGTPNTLTIGTVTTGAVGSDLVATVTGSPPNQTLNLVVPRGVKGQKGPIGSPGPLRQASDYDNSGGTANGAVPVWNSTTSKWTPQGNPGWRGPWTVVENQAWDGTSGFAASQSNVTTSPNTICVVNVPAQDVAWRPLVTGGALVRTAANDGSVLVDLEAHIGSASGQIVAQGPGFAWGLDWINRLTPQFQTSAMTPASSVGVIAAGSAAAIYLVLRRSVGTGAYYYTRTGAHAAVWAVPVTGAP
ncbi:hypothetical protein [Nocardia sp. 852002-20019_SCH5090214]|uniref:hypothetical protein n=1 Tax=Nocardia sp. 852002-20019_SCH5090214 TaxID=1834087 RepID=UPI000AB0BC4C|nr:hypothetical protein [Nocardia sp. 852002-20019_SCH5090214]